jgi:hypothetical protein
MTFGTKFKLNLTFLIISQDKIWIFGYGRETKKQSTLWKIPDFPRLKEAKMSKSKYDMLMIFSSKKELSIQNLFPKNKLSIRHFAFEFYSMREEVSIKSASCCWTRGCGIKKMHHLILWY